MKNQIQPKVLFYGAMLLAVIISMALNACDNHKQVIIKDLPAAAVGYFDSTPGPEEPEAIQPDTIKFKVLGLKDPNTVYLVDQATGDTVLLEVETAFSQAYEEGLIISLIK